MRFMAVVTAGTHCEAGVLPSGERFAEMGRVNEEVTGAGVMLAGEGCGGQDMAAKGM